MTDRTKGFEITRTFDATPEQVWHAWTDPDAVAQWWHPAGAATPRDSVEIDARVGGHYRYAMVNENDGTTVVTGGVYLKVDPHHRLEFTWGPPGADPDEAPIITLSLEPVAGGTSLTLELRGVHGTPGDGYYYDGWVSTLDSLELHVER